MLTLSLLRSFTNHSLSLSGLSRSTGWLLCKWVWEEKGGLGGSDSACGEYFCSSFHYLPLSLPGSPLSPHRRNILISVTALHPPSRTTLTWITLREETWREKMNRSQPGSEGSDREGRLKSRAGERETSCRKTLRASYLDSILKA